MRRAGQSPTRWPASKSCRGSDSVCPARCGRRRRRPPYPRPSRVPAGLHLRESYGIARPSQVQAGRAPTYAQPASCRIAGGVEFFAWWRSRPASGPSFVNGLARTATRSETDLPPPLGSGHLRIFVQAARLHRKLKGTGGDSASDLYRSRPPRLQAAMPAPDEYRSNAIVPRACPIRDAMRAGLIRQPAFMAAFNIVR
jgi:hypothetical protein